MSGRASRAKATRAKARPTLPARWLVLGFRLSPARKADVGGYPLFGSSRPLDDRRLGEALEGDRSVPVVLCASPEGWLALAVLVRQTRSGHFLLADWRWLNVAYRLTVRPRPGETRMVSHPNLPPPAVRGFLRRHRLLR